jgi:hypothetical protein
MNRTGHLSPGMSQMCRHYRPDGITMLSFKQFLRLRRARPADEVLMHEGAGSLRLLVEGKWPGLLLCPHGPREQAHQQVWPNCTASPSVPYSTSRTALWRRKVVRPMHLSSTAACLAYKVLRRFEVSLTCRKQLLSVDLEVLPHWPNREMRSRHPGEIGIINLPRFRNGDAGQRVANVCHPKQSGGFDYYWGEPVRCSLMCRDVLTRS